jgi:hypothetical protein
LGKSAKADTLEGSGLAQELHGVAPEDTLIRIDDKAAILKNREHLAQVAAMFRRTGTGDEDVDQIDEGERQAAEERVHKPLESHAGIFQPERYADYSNNPKGVIVRYHSGGSMKSNARILHLAYMVYL